MSNRIPNIKIFVSKTALNDTLPASLLDIGSDSSKKPFETITIDSQKGNTFGGGSRTYLKFNLRLNEDQKIPNLVLLNINKEGDFFLNLNSFKRNPILILKGSANDPKDYLRKDQEDLLKRAGIRIKFDAEQNGNQTKITKMTIEVDNENTFVEVSVNGKEYFLNKVSTVESFTDFNKLRLLPEEFKNKSELTAEDFEKITKIENDSLKRMLKERFVFFRNEENKGEFGSISHIWDIVESKVVSTKLQKENKILWATVLKKYYQDVKKQSEKDKKYFDSTANDEGLKEAQGRIDYCQKQIDILNKRITELEELNPEK